MRAGFIKVIKDIGATVVVPSVSQTKIGCVETLDEASVVARMFRDRQVDGIVIAAVNFGDEQAAALAIKESGLNVPVLIVGAQEEQALTKTTERRDSFCGLLSIAGALRQIDCKYSVPEEPICYPSDAGFRATAQRFAALCRVVTGIRSARYGQIGAAPRMGCHGILADTTGHENAMGVVEFVMKEGPVTLCRATQDSAGAFKAVIAQGAVEPNKAKTFGAYGWVRLGGLGTLYKDVLLRHFPHHVAMSRGSVGNILWEAFGNYLGFDVYTPHNTGGQWSPQLPFDLDRPSGRKARKGAP